MSMCTSIVTTQGTDKRLAAGSSICWYMLTARSKHATINKQHHCGQPHKLSILTLNMAGNS